MNSSSHDSGMCQPIKLNESIMQYYKQTFIITHTQCDQTYVEQLATSISGIYNILYI